MEEPWWALTDADGHRPLPSVSIHKPHHVEAMRRRRSENPQGANALGQVLKGFSGQDAVTKPFDSSRWWNGTLWGNKSFHQGAALLEGEALKALAAECAEAVAVCEAGWGLIDRLRMVDAISQCENLPWSKMRLQLQKPRRKVAKPSPGRTSRKMFTVPVM